MSGEKGQDRSRKKDQRQKIRAKDIQGLKYFRALRPLLEHLHQVGTERDRAGNRQLHMDHYCMLVLLWLYSPIIDSLRGLQQASELKKVQEKLKLPRASLGSLAESVALFDPEPLKQIARELADQLPEPSIPRGTNYGDTALCSQVIQLSIDGASSKSFQPSPDSPSCGFSICL